MSFDTDAIRANTDIVSVARAYTALKKTGVEYCGPCPIHGGDGDNFYVNPAKRIWSCFSHGCHEREEGNDVIGFLRRVEGLTFIQACERLGATSEWKPAAPLTDKAPQKPERTTSKPPRDAGEPSMQIKQLGAPSLTWCYRDADGEPLGYVARYETPEGKQIRCWTWGSRGGESSWGCAHWAKPRPLYGLDRLAARSGVPVVMVEGEKAADAAQSLLGQMVVITWPGGSQAWQNANFEPLRARNVLLWPDNDIPGLECMGKLAAVLSDPRGLACKVRVLDPSGMADGFDAADWPGTSGELIAWAKPRTSEYRHIEERKHAIPSEESPERDDLPPIEAYADDVSRSATPAPAPKRKVNGSNILGEVFYRPMSEIEAKPIDWLWPGRIAKGKVSMIVGNPGLGKSQVCSSLTSVVSNGGSWPVDRSQCAQGSVVILSAEDDAEDTIRPRLEAAGANLEKVFILDAIRTETPEGADAKRGFDLTLDIARLGAMLHELGDAALVIIDPITAYLGDADSHKNAEVRALLAPLGEMAAHQGVAVIAVSHLTKSSGMDALLRVQGSIGFAAAARAVWGVAKDKDNPARRLFMPLKNNLGTDTNGFAYTVEGIRLPESDIETSHVMWENQIITQTADEVFGQQDEKRGGNDQGRLLEAKVFLREQLAQGPMLFSEIKTAALAAGHKWVTVDRARQEIKVHAYKEAFKSPWKWRLP